MDFHEFEHEMAKVNDNVRKAVKHLAPFYSTEPGVKVHDHLREATAVLDRIDSIILHRKLNREN